MPENPTGSMPEVVCRHCLVPLNSLRAIDQPNGLIEWQHPRPPAEDHEPDPIPRADAPYVVMICDFCSGDGARWAYDIGKEFTNVMAAPTHTAEKDRRRFAKHWETVTPKQGPATDIATNRYSSTWAACDPCSTLIEARDLERLITRVRRLLEQQRLPLPTRTLYRTHFAEFWSAVRERTPLDQQPPTEGHAEN